MVAGKIVVFFISFYQATFSSAFEGNFNSEDFKIVAEYSFFTSKIWTGYSKLLSVDETDTFCSNNAGVVFSDLASKNLYYRCQNGRKELYQCIDGFEFDRRRYRCIPKSIFSNVTNSEVCIYQTNGFYPDYESDCQKYFSCKDGVKVETFFCPPSEAFSFYLQSCQPKREVTCASLNCRLGNDDFFVIPGSKCHAYYFCQRGFRSDFICPKGTTFDIQKKMCVENGICYEPVCTGRIDGTYADTTHNCIRSFTCKGGMLKEVNSCLSGETHDGYSCVSSEFHNCEKPEKTAAAFYFRADDECKSLHDGSHIVPGTDCRNVRICLRGKTTTAFECLRDERYDGNRCVPKGVVPCDDVCSMKADGYYADEFTDCESYYFCLNGKVFKRKQCSKGTAFNGYICVPSHLVSCPKKSRLFAKKCLGLQDGFHPDYLSNCRDYFYCYNHNMVLTGSCSEGFVYNGKQCVSNTASILCDGPKELQACASLPPGLHQNKTSGCTKYFYCSNGRGTELSCPSNQIFNGYKCVSTDEYTCLNPDSCDDQPDGYKQDKNTACRSYYYCSNGNKITYVCPGELIFNGSHCVSPESYECPFIPSADCIEKQDGYHPDRSSNCKDYYYCLKGEKLNTLTCGGKKIFNGRGCVLTEDPRSACLSFLSNPCRLKEDGTYADVKTDCRKYFICKNKLIVNEGWCPKGSGFNGRICKKNYTCSQTERSDCEGQPIGFYQDLSSNCKSYYFCFYNTKTVGICPDGTIFNGQLCIDSNYYTCPSGVTR